METAGQAKEILQVLRIIYQRHMACDFVVVISDPELIEFRVHRAMLAAFCGMFKKMLEAGQLQGDRYQMQAVDSTTMGHLIDYIYTGNLDISQANVWSIIGAASQLEMVQVTTMCQNFLMSGVQSEQPIAEPELQSIVRETKLQPTTINASGDAGIAGKNDAKPAVDKQISVDDPEIYQVFNTLKQTPTTKTAVNIKGEVLTEDETDETFQFFPEVNSSKMGKQSRKRKPDKKAPKGRKKKKENEEIVGRKKKNEQASKKKSVKSRAKVRRKKLQEDKNELIEDDGEEDIPDENHDVDEYIPASDSDSQDPEWSSQRTRGRRSTRGHGRRSRAASDQRSVTVSRSRAVAKVSRRRRSAKQPVSLIKATVGGRGKKTPPDDMVRAAPGGARNRRRNRSKAKKDAREQQTRVEFGRRRGRPRTNLDRWVPHVNVEQLMFTDIKCSICQDVFMHYSTKCLHQRMHHFLHLRWIGQLQRKYMSLYTKSCFKERFKQNLKENTNQKCSKLKRKRPLDVVKEDTTAGIAPDCAHVSGDAINGKELATGSIGNEPCLCVDNLISNHGNTADTGKMQPDDVHCSQQGAALVNGIPEGEADQLEALNKLENLIDQSQLTVTDHCGSELPTTTLSIHPADNSRLCNVDATSGETLSVDTQSEGVVLSDANMKLEEVFVKVDPSESNIPCVASSESANKTCDLVIPEGQELFKLQSKRHVNKIVYYECQLCHVKLPYYSLCTQHRIRIHGFRRRCRRCGATFDHPTALIHHKIRTHKEGIHFKNAQTQTCTYCGKQFLFANNLAKHVSNNHGILPNSLLKSDPNVSNYRPLICRHCGCAFKYHSALLMHLPHHGLTEDEIQLELTDPSRVPLHRTVNNHKPGVRKKCPVCQRLFRAMTTLRQHMNQMHNVRVTKAYIMQLKQIEVKQIACLEDGCQFTAMVAHELERHMSDSHPTVSYQCKLCRYKTTLKKRIAK